MKRNRVAYGLLLLVVLAVVYLLDNRLSYALLIMSLLFPAVSLGITAFLSRRLTVEQLLTKPEVMKGETTHCSIRIENPYPFSCGLLQLHFSDVTRLLAGQLPTAELVLLPLTNLSGSISFTCLYSGVFDIGVETIQLTDYLGLFRFSATQGQRQTLTVLPQVNPLPAQSTGLLSMDVQAKQSLVEDDYSTILDYRQYAPADHIKQIHWKLSAKKNEWIVKNYGSTADFSTAVILDLQSYDLPLRDKMELEDRMREGAVSLLNGCARHEEPADFIYALSAVHISSLMEAGFAHLYDLCSSLTFTGEIAVAAVLEEYLAQKQEAAHYWVLTARPNQPLVEVLSYLHTSGKSVSLFYFATDDADNGYESYAEKLDNIGIAVRPVMPGQGLETAFLQNKGDVV